MTKSSYTDIFLRLWNQEKLTPTLARRLLKLEFGAQDKARIHQLAVKNQEGRLAPAERRELDDYVRIGTLLSILQSRARKALRHRGRRGRR